MLLSLYSTATQILALGVGVGQYPRRKNFALGIPTCWYRGANANPLICVLPEAKPKTCVLPDAKPKRKPVEYRLRWVPTQNSGIGHVHFMFFGLISFALGSQRKPSFQWNMGFRGRLLITGGELQNVRGASKVLPPMKLSFSHV